MRQYLDLLQDIRDNGVYKMDRTGTGTYSVFGRQLRFDLSKGFPLLTTKKMFWKGIVYELLWFLRGETNVQYLQDNGVHIWDEWADVTGYVGPVYGYQWRHWEADDSGSFYIDQIEKVIKDIKTNPNSRRHIVSAWNVRDIPDMALPPCHLLFQFYVANNKLSCQMYQRSCDVFLGVPFNIASYALLTHMIAQITKLEVGEFIHTLGDVHIYSNHIDQVDEQLSRSPLSLSTLYLNPDITDINDFTYDDIYLANYQHHPKITAPIAV